MQLHLVLLLTLFIAVSLDIFLTMGLFSELTRKSTHSFQHPSFVLSYQYSPFWRYRRQGTGHGLSLARPPLI